MNPTEDELDSMAQELIPKLDKVAAMTDVHGEEPPLDDMGGFRLLEAEQLALAIQGQAVMDISTPELLQDGSYRIVLLPDRNWVVQSVLMSGLDSSTEIVLILTPRI